MFISEVLAQNGDREETDAEEPKDEGRIRSDSDTEIGRQVQSIYSQIEKETSWQYHLTPIDIDDGEIVDTHLENDINELVNGEIDQVDDDTNHIDLDLDFGGKHQMTNGDLNANEVEGITLETEDVLLQSKMQGNYNSLFPLQFIYIPIELDNHALGMLLSFISSYCYRISLFEKKMYVFNS